MLYKGKAQTVAETVLDQFKTGNLPRALAPVFIHKHDDVPCRKWSWSNQLLTAMADTADARGYKQWRKVGRHVVKGTKAFYIFIPLTKRIVKEADDGEAETFQAIYGFGTAPVFRKEDTDGEPLPEDAEHENWIRNLPVVEVAEAWGVEIATYSGEFSGMAGYYSLGERKIALGVENLSVWAHELIHAADHRRGGLVELGQHWRSETVAEFGGAVLLKCLGFDRDADLGGAYEYIQRYSETAKITPIRACMDALDRVCGAVNLIFDTAESHRPVSTV